MTGGQPGEHAPLEASLVVPVHNRPDDLRALLADLNAQRGAAFEVIIVDDGSTPPVEEQLDPAGYPFPLVLMRHERNLGAGTGRNVGVTHARAPLIVFIDSDGMVQDPDWIAKHVAYHRDHQARNPGELLVLNARVIGLHNSYAGHAFYYSNWFMSCGKKAYDATGHHLPTHNTSVPRTVFDAVGLFDETLVVLEDADWALRCLRQGVRLRYEPEPAAGHRDRETMKALWRGYVRMGRYACFVRRKQPRSPYGWLFPHGRVTGILYFVPLSCALTLYIGVRWLPIDPRVLWYLPGMHVANVAYCWGIVKSLFGGLPKTPPLSGRPLDE